MNQSWRSLTPKSTSLSIVVTQPRKPGLKSSRSADRVVVAGDGREEALVEVDRLELDLAPEPLHDQLVGAPLDRLDVECGHDLGEVGHVRLGQHRGRQDRLAEEAALLLLVGVAGGAPEPVRELAGQPVRAADAERNRRRPWG